MSISYDAFLNTLTVISVIGVILTRYILKRMDRQIPQGDEDKLR